MANWLQGKIIENRQWNERLFSLRIAASIPEFKAGQFVRIGLEIEGEIVARPYSLVNAPHEPALEVFFNIVPEGPLSPLLAKLQKSDTIQVAEKASGFMVVDEIPECKHLWLFATGTGVGPFLSILKTEQPWQRFEKVVLAYSVRTQSDLVYADLMQSLVAQHGAQLSFVPLVTRESVPDTLSMRIPAAIQSGALEERAGIVLSAEDSHVMMCGNSAMITEVSTLLEARNMRRHRRREPGHITTEKYH
jgi:ferredoxin/flavodoxin---NADP+ reductase